MDGSETDEVVIGLDVGTSSVKAMAFGLDGRPRQMARRGLRRDASNGGRAEQDPLEIIDAAARALAACVDGCTGATVAAVSVATSMHGLLPLDATGAPLGPVLTWADGRATDEATALRAGDGGRRLHRLTGVPVHPMSPLVKLRWIGGHDTTLASAAARWVDVKAWVLAWLCGEVVTDRSSAAGTGLRTIDGAAWCDEALAVAGVAADRLPHVVATTATLRLARSAARRVGLHADTPLVAGAADGPCANVGCGALDPGVIGLSVGTERGGSGRGAPAGRRRRRRALLLPA